MISIIFRHVAWSAIPPAPPPKPPSLMVFMIFLNASSCFINFQHYSRCVHPFCYHLASHFIIYAWVIMMLLVCFIIPITIMLCHCPSVSVIFPTKKHPLPPKKIKISTLFNMRGKPFYYTEMLLRPLMSSWIICIRQLCRALKMAPTIDCCAIGAGPNLNPKP